MSHSFSRTYICRWCNCGHPDRRLGLLKRPEDGEQGRHRQADHHQDDRRVRATSRIRSPARTGLKGEVGAQLNCGMKIKGQDYNVNVTATSVKGDDVEFDMVETVDKNLVASKVSERAHGEGRTASRTP